MGCDTWYGVYNCNDNCDIIHNSMKPLIVPIILSFTLLSGCGGGIAGLLTIISGADVVSQVTTGKNTVDNVVSSINQKDCAVFRMFKGKKVCKDKEEKELLKMNCEVYAWNEKNEPYCKK